MGSISNGTVTLRQFTSKNGRTHAHQFTIPASLDVSNLVGKSFRAEWVPEGILFRFLGDAEPIVPETPDWAR